MRGYEREEGIEDEYYEDYVDEEEQEEGGEEGEEYEYVEEEENQPTQEELEYLGLRERLKESIRKQMKREHGSSSTSQNKRQKLPNDNYGSFFGPSKPVIAQRVIQESKSLLENHHLASKIANTHHDNKKSYTSTVAGSKPVAHGQISRVTNVLKTKVQKLKDTRDYSFLLSDDAETSTPGQEPCQNISATSSDSRSGGSAQVQMSRKQPLGNSSKHLSSGHEERKLFSSNGRMHSKGGPKLTSAGKLNLTSVDVRKQLGSKSAGGPGRPVLPKGLPLKKPVAPGMKNVMPGLHKPSSSKLPSSAPKHHLEQTRVKQEPNRGKVVPKQPIASSKSQTSKPPKPNPSSRTTIQYHRLKKHVRLHSDDEEDDDNPIAAIRKMFRYNPNRYAGRDDDDDSDMEANFDDILREESRSAKIARKEDEEELRKILEEERREAMLKKRKMPQR